MSELVESVCSRCQDRNHGDGSWCVDCSVVARVKRLQAVAEAAKNYVDYHNQPRNFAGRDYDTAPLLWPALVETVAALAALEEEE